MCKGLVFFVLKMFGIYLLDIGKLGIYIVIGMKDKKKVVLSNMVESVRFWVIFIRIDNEK